jgi:hypothetical protein
MSKNAKNAVRKMRQEREDSPFIRRDVEKFRTQQRKAARQLKRQIVNA